MARVGPPDRVLGGLDVAVVLLEVLPVGLRHLPARGGVVLEAAEALAEPLLREVDPQLHDERPVLREHLLEEGDLGQHPVVAGAAQPAEGPLHERLGVPGAEEDADAAPRGQAHPVAPPPRPLPLLVGGRAEGVSVEPARVEPLEHALHRLALARAVGARQEHDDGHAGLLKLALRLEQPEAQLRHLGLELLLAHAAAELGGLEHDGILSPAVIPRSFVSPPPALSFRGASSRRRQLHSGSCVSPGDEESAVSAPAPATPRRPARMELLGVTGSLLSATGSRRCPLGMTSAASGVSSAP